MTRIAPWRAGLAGACLAALVASAAWAGPSATLNSLVTRYEALGDPGEDPDSGGASDARWRLPDVSPAADADRTAKLKNIQSELTALKPKRLGDDERLTRDLLLFSLRDRIEAASFDEARMPFSSDGGFDVMMLYRASGMTLKNEGEARRWIALLNGMPAWYAANIDNARRGVSAGFVQAVPTAEAVLERARRAAATPLADDPLLAPLRALAGQCDQPRRADRRGREGGSRQGHPGPRELRPVHDRRIHPARGQEPGGLGPAGRQALLRLPDPPAHDHRSDAGPDPRHGPGRGGPHPRPHAGDHEGGRLPGRPAGLHRHAAQGSAFYATSRQQLLEKSSEIAKRADDQLPAHFGVLPRLTYGVRPVPASIEQGYTTGRYFGGDPKVGRAGGLMINTSELDQRPLYELPALVLHEGAPGHHIQTSLAQEQTGVPEFRRNLYFTAYGEGWGLYSEWLGEEMGIYRDPYELFGRLSYEMWRACRLVADTGMHWKGWSLEQARACFTDNTALSPVNIEVELKRYVSWPGQALAYKVGELKLIELRHRAETETGRQVRRARLP
jgi:uncharacterized protein (DUF885 family)